MENKYLSDAELKRMELDAERAVAKKLDIELFKREVEIAKLELEILEKNALLKRMEIERKIAAVRVKKEVMKTHRESILGYVTTIEKKYKLKKFVGYNPDSGEIAED